MYDFMAFLPLILRNLIEQTVALRTNEEIEELFKDIELPLVQY